MQIKQLLNEKTKGISILYVEDETETREQITQILELIFSKIFIAHNGEKALSLYQNNSIDLVITDLTMPTMDGVTMIKEMQKIKADQNIIILTAHNNDIDLQESKDLNVDGFLLKPVQMEKMITLLQETTTKIIKLQEEI